MVVSSPPSTSSFIIPEDQDNQLKRRRPNDTPDDHQFKFHMHEGPQGFKYNIEVVCGGRSGSCRLWLDKFINLPDGNKGYGKCIEYI